MIEVTDAMVTAAQDTWEAEGLTRFQVRCILDAALSRCTVPELVEARAQLKAEQDANRKVVQRLCKAMGTWEGPWDNAAEARLKAIRLADTQVELDPSPK